ncbi:ABC transporter substrate-binding protein [Liberiplasma polymorphum]|uniref:ABC transporter substrate-binding protein n=1 Tax=Liberiplasma polymorphum TaxID=3374570 RepID=UPI0037732F64
MKKILLVLALSLSVMTLAACGSKETSQGVTDDKVLVGNTAVTTGPFAFVGVPFNQGMVAYFDMINDQGGVNGRKIELINRSDDFNAAIGLTNTQQLVEDDEVFALVGHFGTPTVGASKSYLDSVGIPRVYYATGINALYNTNATGNQRSSFPVQPIYSPEGEVMVARAVADLNASKIGVIYTNADDGLGMLAGIVLKAAALGVSVQVAQVGSADTDMSSAALSIMAANVDVVIVAANQVPGSVAIRALNEAGNTKPVITSYVSANDAWLDGVKAVLPNFDVYASSWIDVTVNDNADLDLFVQEVSKVDAALATNSFAYAGWVAGAAFVEGLKRVGNDALTWENYINAMEEAPLNLPFGVMVDYQNGRRVGTQSLALLKGTVSGDAVAWVVERPLQSIDEILE